MKIFYLPYYNVKHQVSFVTNEIKIILMEREGSTLENNDNSILSIPFARPQEQIYQLLGIIICISVYGVCVRHFLRSTWYSLPSVNRLLSHFITGVYLFCSIFAKF